MQRIESDEDIVSGLDALVEIDPRLHAVRMVAGHVPLRRTASGFQSLASIITSQQVSRASAEAIFVRLCRLVDPFTPQRLLEGGAEILAAAGLSRPKQRTLTALSLALSDGSLDLGALGEADAEKAMAALVRVPGIGPWTAQVYLLVAAGHADIFPAGDLALQHAAAHALGLGERPGPKDLALIAESWSPWRSVAARLFWAYYGRTKGREVAPIASDAENPTKIVRPAVS